ncbi:MAG: protein kinase [Planctomycetota bacterium]
MPKTPPLPTLMPGRKIGSQYVVEALIGTGSEGAVYRIIDQQTGIHRAAKVFHADRQGRPRDTAPHARKLDRLRHCEIILRYLHHESVTVQRQKINVMISEFCEGIPLQAFIDMQPGQRLPPYMALHVLGALSRGLAEVHAEQEYHADVHTENILIQPRGIHFDLKLIDFYEWGRCTAAKQRQDIIDTARVLYDMIGGARHYAKAPPMIRTICCGLQHQRILKRYPTIHALAAHLNGFAW